MTERQTLLLFAGCWILFLFGTWQIPFLGPDEPRYAQVAREMFESGDYIVPRLGGFVWFEKPALLYWLMALSYALFGVGEFAARLPSALAAFGSVWFLFFTIRKIAGRSKALIVSATLGSTAFFVGFSHAATFDMLLTFCVTAALCCYLLYERFPQLKWVLLFYFFAGLGVLAKGFVSLIVIGATLIPYFLITKQWNRILTMKPVQGILIATAVIAIWFVPVSLIYGERFWNEFVYQHHFVRYTSSYYHRSEGFFFYLPILLAGTYPWSFAPFVAKPNKDSNLIRFSLCWLLGPLLFFSISETKLPGYILPVIPAFAILCGLSIANIQNLRKMAILFAALQIFLFVAFFWGARKYSLPLRPFLWMITIISLLTTISIVLFLRRKWTGAAIVYVSVLVVGMVLFIYGIFPQLSWIDSKRLSAQWAYENQGNEKLVPYNVYDFAPVFYTNGRMELNPQGYPKILTNATQLHRYLTQQHKAHVFAGNEELQWMRQAEFWRMERVLQGRERSIVILLPKYP